MVIEYNCRMGDPETEAVLPRIKTDFGVLMQATADEKLDTIQLEIDARTAATVVMVSGGYPGNYEKGYEVKGLGKVEDTLVFHAGTAEANGHVVTNGGRVFALTSLDETLQGALNKSFAAAHHINYDYAYYRKDIGKDLM
jgi:phosphoribosylamine--glycine ligase